MEDFYPWLINDKSSFSMLDHSVNRYVWNLVKNWDKKFKHILINLSSTQKTKKQIYSHIDWYEVIVFKSYKFLIFMFQFSFELIKFILKIDKKSIIHIHWINTTIFETITPFLYRKNAVIHHRWGHITFKTFPFTFLKYFIFFPFLIRFYNFIIVESKTRKNIFKKTYLLNDKKVIYIPGFINLDLFKNSKIVDNKINKKQLTLLYVWRLEKDKWFLDLIDIYKNIKKRWYDIKLNIIGNGSLEKLIYKLKDKDISFLWFISNEKLSYYYLDSDIFISPTHSESFWLTIIEAMASWLPVLTTYSEWPKDIIDNWINWFLHKKQDINSFVNTAIKLIESSELRKQIGINARKQICNNFSSKNSLDLTLNIYNQFSK